MAKKNSANISTNNYKSMILISYSTEHLLKKDKIRFYYALNGRDGKSGIIKDYKINHIGRAVLLVPSEFEKEIKGFLELWKCNYDSKEVLLKK